MKKALLIIGCIVLLHVIIIGLFLVWFYWIRPSRIGELSSLENYTYYLEKFPSDEVVGPINNANEAREKGAAVLNKVFGEEAVRYHKPLVVNCDKSTNTWKISTIGPPIPFLLGGSLNVIIDGSNGDVLAVWGTK